MVNYLGPRHGPCVTVEQGVRCIDGGRWRVARAALGFFVFSEPFLTGTYACIFGWQMCQGPFWAKPSTDNWSQRPNLSNFCRSFFRKKICRGPFDQFNADSLFTNNLARVSNFRILWICMIIRGFLFIVFSMIFFRDLKKLSYKNHRF